MNINVSYVQIMHGNVERDILDVIKNMIYNRIPYVLK